MWRLVNRWIDKSVSLVLDSSDTVVTMEKFQRIQQETEKEVGELKKLESELAKSLEGKRWVVDGL